ncbi:hypothetical protein CVM73_35620 [Bradyrhizobium forestalis]|uniref:Uncharacterized protein n=1 Tax=Bradyrhizobium forestalis TaxID=1419263 RepID=A0A2M8QYF3_9BRAD|nr:hypothetical protein CVM73_35620 [Bradyrhizobium forestalis]
MLVVARLDRATQYAAASPYTFDVSGILDRPLSRAMTAVFGGPSFSSMVREQPRSCDNDATRSTAAAPMTFSAR